MTRFSLRRRFAPLLAIALACMGALAAPAPALAMQVLDAADHAELAAEISATGINRIALAGDRIAKVVRTPDRFAVEHDAASGDLYLRPAHPSASAEMGRHDPVTLFVGTERGFTYRLTLTPSDRDSAQILIRNAEALPGGGETAAAAQATKSDPHVAALVRLVRAVARRDLLPGYAVHAGGEALQPGLTLIETWRGPRLAALVFEAARPASPGSWSGAGEDAGGPAGLAGTIGSLPGLGPVAALWLAPPATGSPTRSFPPVWRVCGIVRAPAYDRQAWQRSSPRSAFWSGSTAMTRSRPILRRWFWSRGNSTVNWCAGGMCTGFRARESRRPQTSP